MRKKIRLGVNIDHAATLRQVRGGTTPYPNLLEMVSHCKKAGAEQITIHLREDRRHIQLSDLVTLSEKSPLPLNLEMAVTPAMLRLARQYKPDWCCFVPEKRQELTTEGGLDVVKNFKKIKTAIEKLQFIGIEVSLFIDPDLAQTEASFEAGADAVEFHTGTWVLKTGTVKEKYWKKLCSSATLAHQLGLGVHAGHGLDYVHTKKILKMPFLREVNIGHFLVCESLNCGMEEAVRKMMKILNGT